jgi:iron complex outermembrane receptor protein
MFPSHRAALLSAAALAALGSALPQARAQNTVVLPEVSVTATPITSSGVGSFVPVTTLDQPEIVERSSRSLGDTLFTEPGMTSSSFAPGASRPIIRGLDNFRVRLQENGFGANDVSAFGEDHAVPLDPLTAERIEVIRGPASLRWGSQAIGGVVNVINNRIPTALPEEAVEGRISGGWNTGTRGWDGVGSVNLRAGNFVVHADAFGRYDSDYRLPGGGRQLNSGVRTDGKSVGLSYFFDQGFIGSSISHFRSRYEIPGGEEAELRTNIDMEQVRWASRGEYRPGAGPFSNVAYWLGFTTYHHEEIGAEHDEGGDGGAADVDFSHVHGGFRNRSWDGRIELQHVPVTTGIGELKGALGVSFEQERLRTTGEFLEFLPPAQTDRYAGYLFEELGLTPSLRLQAAARLEFVRIDGATATFPAGNLPNNVDGEFENSPRRRDFVPMSVSLGALKDLPGSMQARVTGQYVQRAPSAAELFSRGAHDASGTFDIGDPGLRKEAAWTAEVGLSRQVGEFRFDTSAYLSKFNNFIYRALTGNSCGEEFGSCASGTDEEFLQVAYGQRDARFYGVEAKAEQDLARLGSGTFGVSGRYDFVRAEFTGGGNLPRIPPHRLGGGLWWRAADWSSSLDYLHAFNQNRTGENETPTKGYELLNARVSYTAQVNSGTALTFSLIGSNLLDSDIRNVASFKKDEVLLPGRSLRLLLTMNF